MNYAILKKDDLDNLVSFIGKEQKVVAPVAKGYDNYAFEEIETGHQIALDYIPTILPPKKYFMPQFEKLLEFDVTRGENATAVCEYDKMVVFGVHTCDLAGMRCLDIVLTERPRDYNYLIREGKLTIIGLECNKYCDENASCALMSAHLPNGGYDLMLTDLDDCYIVHMHTYKGEEIVEKSKLFHDASQADFGRLASLREKKRQLFKNEVPIELREIPSLFDRSFDSPVWKDLAGKCLACGNCTNVCPTCYCFDVFDKVNLDLKTGMRERRWDSCQLETFAKVAGGENFRKDRGARQRHRYYRKFRYPLEKSYRLFCTGCGRCTRACMAGIKLKDTLNSLVKESAACLEKK
jgi:sulfhydrogenase subunit beta (sulfur reductase)